ncbi:MAG TPA: hypothetical protein VLJ42_00090 [Solirubrobacteraceae bacterium]|nr:hypothetical protein [Solirubrobacteraceae bacterium]
MSVLVGLTVGSLVGNALIVICTANMVGWVDAIAIFLWVSRRPEASLMAGKKEDGITSVTVIRWAAMLTWVAAVIVTVTHIAPMQVGNSLSLGGSLLAGWFLLIMSRGRA